MRWIIPLLEVHLLLFAVILIIATAVEGYKYIRFLIRGDK